MKQPLDVDHLSVSYLYLAIFTTITVLAWVGFEVFRSLARPAEIEVSAEEQEPIKESLDQEALELIRGRLHIESAELNALEVTPIELAPVEAPEASGSVTIDTTSDTEEATTSGSI
ncbi:MAG: hypothetical protein HYS86_00790 [Candidatus Chisholmbacteria bacterium]|nr:hypothetical protein [Candidatus Chisholmbacteria bacterium]